MPRRSKITGSNFKSEFEGSELCIKLFPISHRIVSILSIRRFFRKSSEFGEILKQRDIKTLCDPTVGIKGNDSGIHVLLDVYRFLFKCELVPKLSSWGQGEGKLPSRSHQANYAALINSIKAGKAERDNKIEKDGDKAKEKPVKVRASHRRRVVLALFWSCCLCQNLTTLKPAAISGGTGKTRRNAHIHGI